MDSEYLKGTSFWNTIMLLSGYVFLGVMMIFLMIGDRVMLIPVMIVFGIWMIIAWTAQREQKIRVLQKFSGIKVLTGTLDEEEDMGEITEFVIKKIVRFEDLTEEQKSKIELLIREEEDLVNSLDRKDNIRYVLEEKKDVTSVDRIEDKSKES